MLSARYVTGDVWGGSRLFPTKLVQMVCWCKQMEGNFWHGTHFVPRWDTMGQYGTWGACALSAGFVVVARWGMLDGDIFADTRFGCLLSLGLEVAVTLCLLHARALQGNCFVCFHSVTFHFVRASGGGGMV